MLRCVQIDPFLDGCFGWMFWMFWMDVLDVGRFWMDVSDFGWTFWMFEFVLDFLDLTIFDSPKTFLVRISIVN